MIRKEALAVKHLALPCYEAIQTIVGKRKCPECDGTGYPAYNPSSEDKELLTNDKGECFTCNGTGKVGWKWTPEVGEWWLNNLNQKIYCIGDEKDLDNIQPSISIDKNIISILSWETIEGVLEGMGYELKIGVAQVDGRFFLSLSEGKKVKIYKSGKTRQEAVMLAVIELSKRR